MARPGGRSGDLRGLAGIGLALALALAGLGFGFRHALNPDGLAYLGLARDLAGHPLGPVDAGVWGTLLPRLATALETTGIPPLAAMRTVLAAAGLLFWGGSVAVVSALGLTGARRRGAAGGIALLAAVWSVAFVTPDLLLAGCLLWGAVPWLLPRPPTPREAVVSGVWLGLAAAAKPAGVGVAVVWVLALAVLQGRRGMERPTLLRGVLVALLLPVLVGAPRVAGLLDDYARFNASAGASGVYDHAIFSRFHVPEPGRITAWETLTATTEGEPVGPPPAVGARLRAQADLSLESVTDSLMRLLDMSWLLAPVLLVAAAGAVGGRRFRGAGAWRAALVPAMLLPLVFAPFPSEGRYLWPALPFVVAAVWGAGIALRERTGWGRWVEAGVVASFLVAAAPGAAVVLRNHAVAGNEAHDLARALVEAGETGPVAGLAPRPGGYAGLYTAYYLGEPWYGDEPDAGPARIRASGATLFVVRADTERARRLAADPGFREAAAAGELRAFRVPGSDPPR